MTTEDLLIFWQSSVGTTPDSSINFNRLLALYPHETVSAAIARTGRKYRRNPSMTSVELARYIQATTRHIDTANRLGVDPNIYVENLRKIPQQTTAPTPASPSGFQVPAEWLEAEAQ